MRIIDSAFFNTCFARAMAKRNSPERPEAGAGYFNTIPGPRPQPLESKTAMMARAAYSREIHNRLNNIRSI